MCLIWSRSDHLTAEAPSVYSNLTKSPKSQSRPHSVYAQMEAGGLRNDVRVIAQSAFVFFS